MVAVPAAAYRGHNRSTIRDILLFSLIAFIYIYFIFFFTVKAMNSIVNPPNSSPIGLLGLVKCTRALDLFTLCLTKEQGSSHTICRNTTEPSFMFNQCFTEVRDRCARRHIETFFKTSEVTLFST